MKTKPWLERDRAWFWIWWDLSNDGDEICDRCDRPIREGERIARGSDATGAFHLCKQCGELANG